MSRHATPFPTQHSRSLPMQRWRRRAVVAGAAVTLLLLLISYIRYELVHDLPNPLWATFGPEYSYVPEQGPPSASLLDTRPAALVAQFIHDYIQVAGTFPCVASLANYQGDERGDLVLDGKGEPCRVHRPVAWVRTTLVEIVGHLKSIPGIWQPEARVHYQVQYSDGERLNGVMHLFPDGEHPRAHSQQYYVTYIHDTCWFMLLASWGFYPHEVQQIPRGLQYVDDQYKWHCAGYD